MKALPYVRISKLSPSDDPKVQTPSFEDYNSLKGVADLSLPIDYWIEGYLTQAPEIGKPVIVEREIRNGIKVSGIFVTSSVAKFSDKEFQTQNSVYKIEYLKWKNL